jgi:hypothetical protein
MEMFYAQAHRHATPHTTGLDFAKPVALTEVTSR